jgi:hypothetical protein
MQDIDSVFEWSSVNTLKAASVRLFTILTSSGYLASSHPGSEIVGCGRHESLLTVHYIESLTPGKNSLFVLSYTYQYRKESVCSQNYKDQKMW